MVRKIKESQKVVKALSELMLEICTLLTFVKLVLNALEPVVNFFVN